MNNVLLASAEFVVMKSSVCHDPSGRIVHLPGWSAHCYDKINLVLIEYLMEVGPLI